MSALAKYFLRQGCEVYGFDKVKSDVVVCLEHAGLKFTTPEELVDLNFVIVYTSAVDKTADFRLLKSRGFKMIKRSELLSVVQKKHKINISVSGSHGKTTATSMYAHVLSSAGIRPTAFIGGEDRKFNNLLIGKNKVCVAEACEYKSNFLDLISDVAVVLNIDNDHLDSFGSMENLKKAFCRFAEKGIAVVNADDANSAMIKGKKTVSFGIINNADYMAKDIKIAEFTSFKVYYKGKFKTDIILKTKGVHNVYNALSVIAGARILKINFGAIKKGLLSFDGVKRRNDVIGTLNGKKVICDYAHHPTEIKALLSDTDKEKTIVIFQPHTYSRTAILKNDFIETFKKVKNLIVYKTYPAREKYLKSGSAKTLYLHLKKNTENVVRYADNTLGLKNAIDEFKNADTLLFIGAGDIYEIALKLTDKK